MLECKVWRTDLERGLMLAASGESLRDGSRSSAANNVSEEAQNVTEVKYNCSVMCHHCSLSPHMPVPTHQHQGGFHLSCLDCTAIASSTLPGQSAPLHCYPKGSCVPITTLAPTCLGTLLALIASLVPALPAWISLCALGTLEEESSGKNRSRDGAETTAKPQGPCD